MLKKMMDAIMLTCQKATELIAVRSYRKLTRKEKVQLSLHLMGCHGCRTFSKQSTFIDHAIDNLHQHPEIMKRVHLSEKKKAEIQNQIEHAK